MALADAGVEFRLGWRAERLQRVVGGGEVGLVQPPVGALLDNTTSYVFWAYGAPHPLRPGMTLTARIRTRPRSLLAWMFDPVLAVQKR